MFKRYIIVAPNEYMVSFNRSYALYQNLLYWYTMVDGRQSVVLQQQQQVAPRSWVAQLRSPNAVQTTYFTFPQVIDISITLHFPVELA